MPDFLGLLEEGSHVDDVLPGRVFRELKPVAILRFEVLGVCFEQVLPVERAGNGAIVGKGHDLTLGIKTAASREEVLEPGVVAIAIGILRQRIVAEQRRHVGIEFAERRANRLVLNVIQHIVGLAAAQIDADLLLHHRQVVGKNGDINAGEIGESLDVVADGKGWRRILRHEDYFRAGILLPLGVVGGRRLDPRAGDCRT